MTTIPRAKAATTRSRLPIETFRTNQRSASASAAPPTNAPLDPAALLKSTNALFLRVLNHYGIVKIVNDELIDSMMQVPTSTWGGMELQVMVDDIFKVTVGLGMTDAHKQLLTQQHMRLLECALQHIYGEFGWTVDLMNKTGEEFFNFSYWPEAKDE